ncbi:MAG TPA: choice-of-anchor tandem repeat GloVer-containing protein, partial [Terriglobales bacterium]
MQLIGVVALLGTAMQAQTFTVLYNFTASWDGALPHDGLTLDAAGNLYGTASGGGSGIGQAGNGTVFRLSHTQSGWRYTLLYTFLGGSDGAVPYAGVVFGPDGALYGTTYSGGGSGCGGVGCGTVFRLTAPTAVCKTTRCPWLETTLYRFSGPDGALPGFGNLLFDQAGAIYGTTGYGGSGCGTVYKLTKLAGIWTESLAYSFGNGIECYPFSGLTADQAGNLYGTTFGEGPGSVYKLSCSVSDCTYETLFDFPNGGQPFGGVAIDQRGNLYGGTLQGGYQGGSMLFELAQGTWNFSLLQTLGCCWRVYDTPTLDDHGTVYGTLAGSSAPGEVFAITSGNAFSVLHSFTGDDGYTPYGG